jgi:hypothetical protein
VTLVVHEWEVGCRVGGAHEVTTIAVQSLAYLAMRAQMKLAGGGPLCCYKLGSGCCCAVVRFFGCKANDELAGGTPHC